jgi:uncharacterized membrane protein YfcA
LPQVARARRIAHSLESVAIELGLILTGAFAAAFVAGAAGFGDALVAGAIWLHVLAPLEAVPLIVSTGLLMHSIPVWRLRRQLCFDRLTPFVLPGIFGVPIGIWLLQSISPEPFRHLVGWLLVAYAGLALCCTRLAVAEVGGRAADGAIGLAGGVLGGFAGLSGVLPTLWTGLRGWPRERQRGVYQPFIWLMHALTLASLGLAGMVTTTTGGRLLWCLPAIAAGSWLGLRVWRRLDERRFRRAVLALLLASGVTLVL